MQKDLRHMRIINMIDTFQQNFKFFLFIFLISTTLPFNGLECVGVGLG